MEKLNNSLNKVRVGEDDRVPIESNRKVWFLWTTIRGDWDAEAITRSDSVINALISSEVVNVFCVWHGGYRTDLFLMNKEKLINRLKKLTKKNGY